MRSYFEPTNDLASTIAKCQKYDLQLTEGKNTITDPAKSMSSILAVSKSSLINNIQYTSINSLQLSTNSSIELSYYYLPYNSMTYNPKQYHNYVEITLLQTDNIAVIAAFKEYLRFFKTINNQQGQIIDRYV
jgi:hypothetical protein